MGRRVPKSWFKRQVKRVGGLLSFQENIWIMIKQSMSTGKRKCNASGKGKWVQTIKRESEDLHYDIEWLEIVIQGSREFEKEEHEDTKELYKPFGALFKKDYPKDQRMSKHFKTKILSTAKVEEAYKKGYGSIKDNNLSNKLLEMGILTHVELIDDYDTREVEIKHDL